MTVRCDCGREAELVGGDIIYPHRPDLFEKNFWLCKPCDAYVGCHPPVDAKGKGGQGDGTVPLGRLANAELRRWKSNVHQLFDPIWKSGKKSRGGAYKWLAEELGIEIDECHIGIFDIETCKRAIAVCRPQFQAIIVEREAALKQ
jgi:hypothetical protein